MKTLALAMAACGVLGGTLGGTVLAQPVSNVSGKWQIEIAPPAGAAGGLGGATPGRIVQVLILNQVGAAVEGEMDAGGPGSGGSTAPVNNEIHDGKVDGQAVSFYVWRGNDRPAKAFYKGTLNARGDEIAFVVTGGPPPRFSPAGTVPPSQQVVAKRVK